MKQNKAATEVDLKRKLLFYSLNLVWFVTLEKKGSNVARSAQCSCFYYIL